MSTDAVPSPPPAAGARPSVLAGRPATVVAACVLLVVHCLIVLFGLASSVVSLLGLVLTNPGIRETITEQLPVLLLGNAGSLVLVAGDVVFGLGVWRGRGWARVAQTVLSGLAVALGLAATLAATSHHIPPNALLLVGVGISAAVVVLLWLPATTAFLRTRARAAAGSVGPAGPGA